MLLDLILHLFFCQLNNLPVLPQIGCVYYSGNKYWARYSDKLWSKGIIFIEVYY